MKEAAKTWHLGGVACQRGGVSAKASCRGGIKQLINLNGIGVMTRRKRR